MSQGAPEFKQVFDLPHTEATIGLGRQIAGVLQKHDCVALQGALGAGKTVLARAILQALGVDERIPSPTFTMVQCYETPTLYVSHFDLYRVKQIAELTELGLEEALDQGAVLVEWPERAPGRIPPDALHVEIRIESETSREAHLSGPSRWSKVLNTETLHAG